MGRLVRIYKRILDISLLVSFGLLLLLVGLLLYGVFTQQFDFTGSAAVIEDFNYEMSLIVTTVGIAVFVIIARVFLALMNNVESLETADQYRKKIKQNKTTVESFSESTIYQELNRKKEQLLVEEEEEDVMDGQISFAEEIYMVENSDDLVTTDVGEQTTEKLFYTRINKGEIIALISKTAELSTYKGRKFLNAFLDIVTEELKQGNDVKIEEFGRFTKQLVKEKVSVNPQTSQRLVVPEHNTVKFIPYKKFKELITEDVIATSDRYLLTDTVKRELSEDELQNELIKENIKQKHVAKKVKKGKSK
jgi:DNA-binding protein HU-beta